MITYLILIARSIRVNENRLPPTFRALKQETNVKKFRFYFKCNPK